MPAKTSVRMMLGVAVVLAMGAGQICFAQTACTYYNPTTNTNGVRGGGIFVQPGADAATTLTVVNLTSFILKSTPIAMLNSTHGDYPFQKMTASDKSLVVDVSRSKIWKSANNDWDAGAGHYSHPRYEGIMQWELNDTSGNPRAMFKVNFAAQNDGTWLWLSGMSWSGWCAAGAASATCGGIYRTEAMYEKPEDPNGTGTGSLKMHNIMTLGNSQFVVALYGLTDNEHSVLVVREVTPGEDYYGFNLDWVDQDGGVPGECNN